MKIAIIFAVVVALVAAGEEETRSKRGLYIPSYYSTATYYGASPVVAPLVPSLSPVVARASPYFGEPNFVARYPYYTWPYAYYRR